MDQIPAKELLDNQPYTVICNCETDFEAGQSGFETGLTVTYDCTPKVEDFIHKVISLQTMPPVATLWRHNCATGIRVFQN